MLKSSATTSGQDGGIGRYTVPPHTTKRMTTTNLKTKNNQNCQKIELYGSPTNKELKRHSFRQVGGAQTGKWGGEVAWQGHNKRTGAGKVAVGAVPHLHEDKLGGKTGEQDRLCNPGFLSGKIKPQSF